MSFVGAWLLAALGTAWWMSPPDMPAAAREAARLRAAGRIDDAVAVLRSAEPRERNRPATLELLGGLERDRGRLAEAEVAFRAALQQGSASAEARLGLGEVLMARARSAEAIAVLAGAVPRMWSQSQQQRWLALVAQTGDAAALDAAARRLLEVAPHDPVALTRALEAAERLHDWPRAASIGRTLAGLDGPRRADARARVARAQEAGGDLTGALETLRTLDEAVHWRTMTRLLVATGRADQAAVMWRRYAGGAVSDHDRRERAVVYERAGWTDAALADYRAVSLHGRADDGLRMRVAWALNRRRAHREAWRVAASLPITGASLDLLAFTAGWAGEDDRAAVLLPQWLAAHPRDTAGWALLAEVARRRGDAAARTHALRALVSLEPDRRPTQTALARHLSASGDTDGAIAAYRVLLNGHASVEPAVLRELATLLEQEARFAEALDVLARLAQEEGDSAGIAQRQARVSQWNGDAAGAAAAWQRAMRLDARLAADADAQAELARALADTGQWEAAAQALEVALRPRPADAALLGVAALVETRRGQPARAVAHLQRLGAHRALTSDERRWLAGQAEQAGLTRVAAAEYDRLLASGDDDLTLWEKIAELEARDGHHDAAWQAWRQVPAGRRDATYWRRLTWAAARVGPEPAMAAYADAYAAGHADAAQCLEAARLHAAAGQPADAMTWYRRHLAYSGRTGHGLELELAQAALAAGAPRDALAWGRQAHDAGAPPPEARFLEAQALHLLGESRAAGAILATLVSTPEAAAAPVVADWFGWLGRTSQARGRVVDAYRRYGEALQRGATPAGEFWLARGDIAAGRGDVARAAANYAEAARAGVEQARPRLDALDAQRQPTVDLPGEVFWDSNDFRQASASARLVLRPSDRARLTAEWASGHVSQGATAFDRRAATVRLDRVHPTARTTVAGQVGVEQARGASQPSWRLEGGHQHPSGASLQLEAFRESPWRAETWDARMRYNRITMLSAIPGDFHATGGKLGAAMPIGEHHELQGNVAARRFSDGNGQVQAYVQYQLPLSSRQATWIAVQPFAYVERWERSAAAYFSPDRQVSTGATVRAIVTRGPWTIDASATPQYLDSEKRTGFGYAAVGSVRRDVGRLSLGATGMVFDDRQMRYRVQRLTVDVRVPVGR